MTTKYLSLTVPISADDLLDALSELNREELLQLIKDLDEKVAEWDFTENLHEHFSELHREFLLETADEADEEEDDDDDEEGDENGPGTEAPRQPRRILVGDPGAGHHPGNGDELRGEAGTDPGLPHLPEKSSSGGGSGPSD